MSLVVKRVFEATCICFPQISESFKLESCFEFFRSSLVFDINGGKLLFCNTAHEALVCLFRFTV